MILVDGQWGNWSEYSACTKTCGTGYQKRSRGCTNPPPSGGGKQCPGSASESRSCNIKICQGTYGIKFILSMKKLIHT